MVRWQQDCAAMWAGRFFAHSKPSVIFNGVGEHPNIGLGRNTLDHDLIRKAEHAWTKTWFRFNGLARATGRRLGDSGACSRDLGGDLW